MNSTPRETLLADSLVAASAAARRFDSRRRVAGRVLVASSLLLSVTLGMRIRARATTVYVIRGDSSGVVLTGPGLARRTESVPARPARRGGRA